MIRLLATSGRGPAECRLALTGVMRQLAAEAEAVGLSLDCVPAPFEDPHGPPSAILLLEGDGADVFARSWIGTHQWIGASPLRPHHRRKNWFVAIHALTPIAAPPRPLERAEVRFEPLRAGGPGGQHQNRTESAVRATHLPTGRVVVVRDQRSQARNKEIALRRLAEMLRSATELSERIQRERAQAEHDSLERGRPVRVFRGPLDSR